MTPGRPASGYDGDLTPGEAWDLLSEEPAAVLVDVRTRAEWAGVGVPDVTTLGRPAVFAEWVRAGGIRNPAFLDEVRAEAGLAPGDGRPLVFICRSGHRSAAAARAATAAGLGPAYNVIEGFEGDADAAGRRELNGWRVAGLPWRLP